MDFHSIRKLKEIKSLREEMVSDWRKDLEIADDKELGEAAYVPPPPPVPAEVRPAPKQGTASRDLIAGATAAFYADAAAEMAAKKKKGKKDAKKQPKVRPVWKEEHLDEAGDHPYVDIMPDSNEAKQDAKDKKKKSKKEEGMSESVYSDHMRRQEMLKQKKLQPSQQQSMVNLSDRSDAQAEKAARRKETQSQRKQLNLQKKKQKKGGLML